MTLPLAYSSKLHSLVIHDYKEPLKGTEKASFHHSSVLRAIMVLDKNPSSQQRWSKKPLKDDRIFKEAQQRRTSSSP